MRIKQKVWTRITITIKIKIGIRVSSRAQRKRRTGEIEVSNPFS